MPTFRSNHSRQTVSLDAMSESVKRLNAGVVFIDGYSSDREKMIAEAFANRSRKNAEKASRATALTDRCSEKRSATTDMNASERRFYVECLHHDSGHVIITQPKSFRLTKKNTYTPDFMEIDREARKILIHEVKGGYRGAGWEQGYDRYKWAASLYDCDFIEFWMHELIRGKWKHIKFTEIKFNADK